jgi:hypothetical protein
MPNLRIDQNINAAAQAVKDETGQPSPLALSSTLVGIGTQSLGKEFEVVGNVAIRMSPDPGFTALGFASEANGLGSMWVNGAYDPARPGSGWKRTINLVNGNVGIGKDPEALNPQERLVVVGNILATGDVRLAGADCAEEFDIDEDGTLQPGTVMVIGENERLRQSTEPYDTRVAGVLSGAGTSRPGIVLGRQNSSQTRQALALVGKVFCKVDALYSPIAIGDLLTTSPTNGHAMKASDPTRALGAILGKALRPLSYGQGLLPVLIALQ